MGFEGFQVVRHNVFDFLEICSKKFDIVFADPPYDISGLETIPEKVISKDILNDGGLFIMEHPGTFDFSGKDWFVKEKKYGNVHFTFFEKKL